MAGSRQHVSFAGRLRAARSDGRPVVGAWLGTGSPHLLDLLCGTAIDYVGLDCQHGLMDETEVARWLAAAPPTSVGRLVRVSGHDPAPIGRVLDAGADGVIVPTVDSPAQAAAVVAAARFPPDGRRSYGPTAEYLPRRPEPLAERAVVLAMIETATGLDAVADILAVPGLDGVYVGPADLGISLGIGSAQFPPSEELRPALQSVADAGRRSGKVIGAHAGSEHVAKAYLDLGFDVLTLGTERSFVATGVRSVLDVVSRATTQAEGPRLPSGAGSSPY